MNADKPTKKANDNSSNTKVLQTIRYKYESSEDKAKDIFFYSYNGNYSTMHNHECWELFILLDGSFTHVINGESIQMDKNCAALLRPRIDVHAMKNADSQAKHFTLQIRDSRMREVCAKISPTFYEELISNSRFILRLNDLQTNKIINYATIISSKISNDTETLMFFLLTYILEKFIHQTNFFDRSKPQWFLELLLKINMPENIHWSVNDVVAQSNFSHTHLLREYKKYEGCTLMDYLTKIKTAEACNLLLYSDMSMLDIAMKLGYSDSAHLNRTFKKIYNMSLSEFRRRNRQSL